MGGTTCFFGFGHLCSLSCQYSPCPGELRALGAVAERGFRPGTPQPAAKIDVNVWKVDPGQQFWKEEAFPDFAGCGRETRSLLCLC